MSLLDFALIDLPIEFKQVNPEDFDSTLYKAEPKVIITPNDKGYISEQIISSLNPTLHTKNTVVINAGVGQGKSYSVIELIKEYSKLEEYVIILAVPYNNLINQYISDLSIDGVNNNPLVFNMMDIDNYTFDIPLNNVLNYGFTSDSYLIKEFQPQNYKIHVMSINALLGNSGDNSLFQSNKKVKYFNNLQTYCETNNKKIILFFDEIHDSIHNFKEDLIYGFWRYHNLIHKVFVVSATFNEASKEVIKYLSEFTNKEIQILESERKVIPEQQSRLHLIFNSSTKLFQNDNFMKLFTNLASKRTSFDFIVYSKKQIENNFKGNSQINQLLQSTGSKINYCYADTFDNSANMKYEENAINIGTNFTTGVNITKINHVMFIFIPIPLDISFVNNNGAFTSIPNSIVQALARQRKPGDIYIIMPPPKGIKLDTLPYQIEVSKQIIEVFNKYRPYRSSEVNYTNINKQNETLDDVYNFIKEQFNKAESNINNDVSNRVGMNRLQLPTKELFILEKGEQYLSNNFFGGDIATYIFWASITNQFLNCKLTSIVKNDELFFTSDDIQEKVFQFYDNIVISHLITDEEGVLLKSISGIKLFEALEHEIINSKVVYINGKKTTKKDHELIKLYILHCIVYTNQKIFEIKESKKELFIYYIQSCVKHAKRVNFNNENNVVLEIGEITLDYNFYELVSIYKDFSLFIDLVNQSIIITPPRAGNPSRKILSTHPDSIFKALYIEKNMSEKLNYLCSNDKFLKTDIFQFRDSFSRIDDEDKKVYNFYGIITKIAFDIKKTTKYQSVTYDLIDDIVDFNNIDVCNLLHEDFPDYVI